MVANLDEKGHCVSIHNEPEATSADTVSFALEQVMPYVHTGALARWRMPRPKDVVDTAIAETGEVSCLRGTRTSGAALPVRTTLYTSHGTGCAAWDARRLCI